LTHSVSTSTTELMISVDQRSSIYHDLTPHPISPWSSCFSSLHPLSHSHNAMQYSLVCKVHYNRRTYRFILLWKPRFFNNTPSLLQSLFDRPYKQRIVTSCDVHSTSLSKHYSRYPYGKMIHQPLSRLESTAKKVSHIPAALCVTTVDTCLDYCH